MIRVGQAMKLAKLARLSGLNADTIDRLEIGKDEVNLWHLLQLARALGVDEMLFLTKQV